MPIVDITTEAGDLLVTEVDVELITEDSSVSAIDVPPGTLLLMNVGV